MKSLFKSFNLLNLYLKVSKVEPVPTIEPITNHTRTSVSTAVIRQVECKNFPDDCQVTIGYYDEDGYCLGEFQLGGDHLLTKLKEMTRKISVKATDSWENLAESEFVIDEVPGK